MPLTSTEEKISYWPKLLGSLSASLAQIGIFHPTDTALTRISANPTRFFNLRQPRATLRTFAQIALDGNKNVTPQAKVASLYQGVGAACVERPIKSALRFVGPDIVATQVLIPRYSALFERVLGPHFATPCLYGLAAMSVQPTECLVYPLDFLKTHRQAAPATGQKNLMKLAQQQKGNLFRGWPILFTKGAIASFSLFSTSEFIYREVFGLDHRLKASDKQHVIASSSGALASTLTTFPLDVLKIRLQLHPAPNLPQTGKTRCYKIATNIALTEGYGAFFKGMGLRTASSFLKVLFSFTLTNLATARIQNYKPDNVSIAPTAEESPFPRLLP